MDERILALLACPACRGALACEGDQQAERITKGTLRCDACGLSFPIRAGIPKLAPPGTDVDGTLVGVPEKRMAGWVAQQFTKARRERDLGAATRDLIEAVQRATGPVIDIATGPGGGYCAHVMADGRTDRLLIMSDLAPAVMHAWRRELQAAGWGERCSQLVLDARRMPFREACVTLITSVGGYDNIHGNAAAYDEAARVLCPGGGLIDVVRFYQDDGPTQAHLTEWGQAAASWSRYVALMERLGFRIDRSELVNTGRGKTDPADGLPLDSGETWEHRIVHARRCC